MKNQMQMSKFTEADGFIAALDQSGGSTPKALRNYGIEDSRYDGEDEMMTLMHAMRTRIVTSPQFSGKHIIGAILFERTMDSEIEGMMAADYLWEKRDVIPLLKIDVGLAEQEDGVSLMNPIPKMDLRLEHACSRNIFGTKMRSVIYDADQKGVDRVVSQQFEFANKILDHGLVPIVEPEVSIDSPKKAECEEFLRNALSGQLSGLPADRKVALKLTLPETANFYQDIIASDQVLRVTALSGGYDIKEACRRLSENQGMIASFSRALAEGLHESMTDADFNKQLGEQITEIFAASTA